MELVVQPGEDPSSGIRRNSMNVRDNFVHLFASVLKGSEICYELGKCIGK
jgi:hypothetical protein